MLLPCVSSFLRIDWFTCYKIHHQGLFFHPDNGTFSLISFSWWLNDYISYYESPPCPEHKCYSLDSSQGPCWTTSPKTYFYKCALPSDNMKRIKASWASVLSFLFSFFFFFVHSLLTMELFCSTKWYEDIHLFNNIYFRPILCHFLF